jgi:ATP-binding cassette subfamily C protein
LIGLVKPLTGYMVLAIAMGLIGHLCATFITVFGGYTILNVLSGQPTATLFASVLVFALLRGFLRYAEQSCNHYIAFKLLALIRDQVFGALRRLCPAKLEGKDKGDLISIITSVIFLLLSFVHTLIYRKKLGVRRWALLATVVISFVTGLFGMILDHIPAVLILHRALSIALVFFLAIHIFVFHKRMQKSAGV